MKLLFIFIGLLGLILLIYSIIILYKMSRTKKIVEFPLDSETRSLELNATGLFSICILGAGFTHNRGSFSAELKTENGRLIKLNQDLYGYRFRQKGVIGLEYYHFKINETGKHTLVFKNLKDLSAKKSMLYSKRIFQKEIDSKFLKIIVKETVTTTNRMFSIIGLVVGTNALAWGILLGLTDLFS